MILIPRHADYRLDLKSRFLSVFNLVMSALLLAFGIGVGITHDLGAQAAIGSFIIIGFYITLFLISLALLRKGQYYPASVLVGLGLAVGQIARVLLTEYGSDTTALINSLLHFYTMILFAFFFCKRSIAVLITVLIVAGTQGSLILHGYPHGLPLSSNVHITFAQIFVAFLSYLMSVAESRIVLDVKKRGEESEQARRSLEDLLTDARKLISELTVSASEIASSSDAFASSSQEEAASLEQITSTMEELSASGISIADAISRQNRSLEQIFEKIRTLYNIVQNAGSEMGKAMGIKQKLDLSIDSSQSLLSESVGSVRQIVSSFAQVRDVLLSVQDISDQINLLALNASIESARAGEHGRGFAVIADEINKLSQRTAASAKEILSSMAVQSQAIEQVQKSLDAVSGSVIEMIASAKAFGEGVGKVGELAQEDMQINQSLQEDTRKVGELLDMIQSAVGEQKVALEEVSRSVGAMNEVIQNNAGGAEELSSSTDSIRSMLAHLDRSVNRN